MRKILSLFFIVLVAAACTAPAASATPQWTHNGQPIEETELVEFAGYMEFKLNGGSWACELGAQADLYAGKPYGEVTYIEMECPITNGVYATCKIEVDEIETPIPMGATESGEIRIYIPSFVLDFSQKEFAGCHWSGFPEASFVGPWTFKGTLITLVPDDPEAMSTFELSATISKIEMQPEGWVQDYTGVTGAIEMWPPGEYGIL